MPQSDSNKNRIAEDIVSFAADSLTVEMRSLSSAFAALRFVCNDEAENYSTDGKYVYFNADEVIAEYLKDRFSANRKLLHCVFHCLFRHIFRTEHKDNFLWDIACDISAENAVIESGLDCVQNSNDGEKKHYIDELRQKVSSVTAENLYYYLLDNSIDSNELEILKNLFSADCHNGWYGRKQQTVFEEDSYSENGETPSIYKRADDRPSRGEDEKGQTSGDNGSRSEEEDKDKWERIAKKVAVEAEFELSQRGNRGGNSLQELSEIDYTKYDYSEFLRQFAVTGEAMEIDDSEFDYIYYTYGMALYENMPLIEPLEYSESNKIRDFIIAIDTSGSVKGVTVQKFIEKTFQILKNSDSFFENTNIHIIQCDAAIQDDSVIRSEKELNDYISDIRLHGFGGTDFRPVFEYADRLLENKTMEKISGLIYFTDGDGVYPKTAPKYKTAFILHGKNINTARVPSWACKMILRENELRSE